MNTIRRRPVNLYVVNDNTLVRLGPRRTEAAVADCGVALADGWPSVASLPVPGASAQRVMDAAARAWMEMAMAATHFGLFFATSSMAPLGFVGVRREAAEPDPEDEEKEAFSRRIAEAVRSGRVVPMFRARHRMQTLRR